MEPAERFEFPPVRVLVAEDDPDFRDLLQAWLREEGFEVTASPDGIDLLRCLQMSVLSGELPEFGLIVSDVHMPLASAFDVLEEFLACDGVPPVLLITAFGGRRTRRSARLFGAEGFLEKPFGRSQLLAEVRRLCGRKGSSPASSEVVR